MSKIMNNDKLQMSSNKSFGIVFFVFFLIISLFPLLKDGNIRIWAMVLAIIFLILGLLNSTILNPLNKIWIKFGILLGTIISPIVMGIVFFVVVTPTSLIMRILGKNLLGLKKDNTKRSYWLERLSIKSKMKNQF
ncbi:SxtJ family membrane protein [Candidatus Pelagibacter bacterium]|nr:SxtJ family membrane protein [Candidatus Pelagibacter bacterium]